MMYGGSREAGGRENENTVGMVLRRRWAVVVYKAARGGMPVVKLRHGEDCGGAAGGISCTLSPRVCGGGVLPAAAAGGQKQSRRKRIRLKFAMQGKANDTVRAGETPGARWLGAPSRRKILLGIGSGSIVLLVFLLVAWPLLAWCAFTSTGRGSFAGGEGAAWAAWVQSFVALEALVACVAAATAICVYFHECRKRDEEKDRLRKVDEEAKESRARQDRLELERALARLHVQNLDKFWSLCLEFNTAVDNLAVDGTPGGALDFLVDKYFLRDHLETDPKRRSDLDKDFMEECKKFGVPEAADKLWRLMNWILFQDEYLASVITEDKEALEKIHNGFVNCLSKLYLARRRRFVFGKFRHLQWKISETLVRTPSYQTTSVNYSDAMLRYPPTLAFYPDTPENRRKLEAAKADFDDCAMILLKREAMKKAKGAASASP